MKRKSFVVKVKADKGTAQVNTKVLAYDAESALEAAGKELRIDISKAYKAIAIPVKRQSAKRKLENDIKRAEQRLIRLKVANDDQYKLIIDKLESIRLAKRAQRERMAKHDSDTIEYAEAKLSYLRLRQLENNEKAELLNREKELITATGANKNIKVKSDNTPAPSSKLNASVSKKYTEIY